MTSQQLQDRRLVQICLAGSLLAHFVFAGPLDYFKPFQLGSFVVQNQPVFVDLQETLATAPSVQVRPATPSTLSPTAARASQPDPAPEQRAIAPAAEQDPAWVSEDSGLPAQKELPTPPGVTEPSQPMAGHDARKERQAAPALAKPAPAAAPLAPLITADEFLSTEWETLTYRFSIMGIPVGSAELQASQEHGEVRFTLRIQSNAALSQLYPVDDCVETRHMAGNYILTRIRQREGSFRGDRGFTLLLREQSVFWIDRLNNLSVQEPLPNSSVVDILSGLYYLRNQPLEVGKPVLLQLFDSNQYAPTSIEVLRREHLTLPGLREVDTLLLHSQLKSGGIFQRTGEILVWVTDDQNKVPVKVETQIPLGKVTAELVSAQSRRRGDPAPTEGARSKIAGGCSQ
jgi:hypothetical protein